MSTNVKLPNWTKKFLSLYSVILVVIGIVAIALLSVHNLKKENTVSAQQDWGTCSCQPGNLGCGFCTYNQTSAFDDYCQGRANEAGETYIAMCWTTNNITCERLAGSVCDRQYADGSWAHDKCGNPKYNPQSPPSPPPPPPSGCPYESTQARVQEDMYHDWYPEITIEEGASFRIGSFHGTGQFVHDVPGWQDTRISVTGPGGFSFSCNTSNSGCDGHTINDVIVGTYTVSVSTHDPDGGFYSESACNGTATVNVINIPNPTRDFTLEKRVVGPTSYNVGDTITFEVVITNTGEITIDDMEFYDEYNSAYLRFSDISGERREGTFIYSQTSLRSVIYPTNPNGFYSIEDLTDQLGDLYPGQQYIITERYVALTTNNTVTTCNFASAEWLGITREDEACLTIVPKTPPPTDR